MFCPQCGSQQSDELKFCKLCGANLQAVLQVMATRETDEKFDWSKTWVAEMFLPAGERKRREEELERQRGITPEVKRYKEIKAGVIAGSAGIGGAIFLYVLMQGIILSGNVPPGAAEILSRLWVAGVIPLFVGIALIVNGLFVSRRLVEIAGQGRSTQGRTFWSGTQNLIPCALTGQVNSFPPALASLKRRHNTWTIQGRNKKRRTNLSGKSEYLRRGLAS